MPKKLTDAGYHPTQTEIYDLIMSSQKRLTTERLADILRQRGICVSPVCPREYLARYASTLPISYSQLRTLVEATDTADRKERTSSVRIAARTDLDRVLGVVNRIKDRRSQQRREKYVILDAGANCITVAVEHIDTKWSANRLRQQQQRELSIEIEKTDEGLHIRHGASAVGEAIVADILREIKVETTGVFEESRIDLSGIRSPKSRTDFFVRLMKMNGRDFEIEDVSEVSVDRNEDKRASKSAEAARAALESEVKKVALHGGNLLKSKQFQSLTDDGFFVSRSVWRSYVKSKDLVVEFDVSFGDAENCSDFKYVVRGIYDRNKHTDEVKSTPRNATPEERLFYIKCLEDAAREAVAVICAEASSATSDMITSLPGFDDDDDVDDDVPL